MRTLIVILSLSFFLTAKAQESITVSGVVRDSNTHQTLEAVNVMLQSLDGKLMYGFALTDAKGEYSIQYKGKAEELSISISGFNVKKAQKTIGRTSQQIDFLAESSSIKIKEVVVKPRVIERTGDTISYNVNSFKDLTDYSIGDVLRKLPGIEIEKNGLIRYNGLAISKFYVEGMDMFEGRYGIATNNIRAKDIASVEVLENHQPIKVLKELTLPQNAAINLRLKQASTGIWGGTLKGGVGYKPTLWNAEATSMYFGRKLQNMNVYKSNNTGNDIADELRSHYAEEDGLMTLTGIQQPNTPYIDEQRYLDNNIHLVNTNTISRLNKNLNLTANAYYIHDLQNARGEAVSTYYRAGLPPLIISEAKEALLRKDHTGISLKTESNKESFYLNDKFTFAGEWHRDIGNLFNNSEEVSQRFNHYRNTFGNQFRGIWKINDFSINISSDMDYETLPTTLCVSPFLYPEIFNGKDNVTSSVQYLDSKRFRTHNRISTNFNTGRWSFYVKASADADLEWMQSSLQPTVNNHELLPPDSDMLNDIYWRRTDLSIGPSASYRLPQKCWITIDCPFDFMNLKVENKIHNDKELRNKLFLRPSLSVEAQLTRNLKLLINSSYNEDYGGMFDSYEGAIMTDYRTISTKSGGMSHTKLQRYSISFSYADILRSLFGSLNAHYYRSKQNLIYDTYFKETLSYIQAVEMPNITDGCNIHGSISKYLSGIGTTLNLSATYSRIWNDILRQDQLMKVSLENISAGIGTNVRFCPSVLLDYHLTFAQNRNYIEAEKEPAAIKRIQQNATFSIIIHKKTVVSIGGEHYYNNAIEKGSRNMFFADAKIKYQHKRMEYSLEARNLFAKHYFFTAHYDDATGYEYTYRLRSPSVMFNIGFNL